MESFDSIIAATARRALAAGVGMLLLAGAVYGPAAHAQNAVRGKMLYGPPVPTGWPITCGSSNCHDGFPTVRKNKINNGTNPATTLNAINKNTGGMGVLQGFVTSTDAADIAAYIANPAAANGPSIAVSPQSLTFSYTLAGSTSAPMSFTVTNGGAASLALTSIATSGANASEFRIAGTSTCTAGGSVAAGGNCRVDVVFAPTSSGTKSAAVTIAHNASGGTTTVALSGSAGAATPTISLSASSLSFATVPVGSTSAAQTVTLSNTGSAALNITALTAGGSNPGDFSRGGTCAAGGTVAAGANCTIAYTFAPSAIGARSASLTIASNNSGGNVTLTLTGSGVDDTPAIALSRTSIAFGNQQAGTTSAAQTVTVGNAGGGTLSVSGVAASNGAFVT
ncbi:MAG: choice-of-anchor D domain-containing protein, partial [Burkholderiaceae bacterium]